MNTPKLGEIEEWRPIDGWPGYLVSSFGRVANTNTGRMLKFSVCTGYYGVGLCRGHGRERTLTVHRLVAKAFIPNPNNHREVNHKDTNRKNNYHGNLEWVTSSRNSVHALEVGAARSGERSHHARLKATDVLNIRRLSSQGMNRADIAKLYSISKQHLCKIVNNQKWKYIQHLEEEHDS